MNPAPRKQVVAVAIIVLLIVIAIAATVTIRGKRARDALMRADPETILGQPELAKVALRLGHRGFVTRCASCHGDGSADRARGIPDLTDRDYLYGSGTVAQIEQIILHGIRSGDPRGWALASMPVYASAKPYAAEPIPPLSPRDIDDVAQYVLGRHAAAVDRAAAIRGEHIFRTRGGCWDCHGNDGAGDTAIGAPNLLDDVWLYGDGSLDSVKRSISGGRAGIMPAFDRALTPVEARAIAVYTASLSRRGTIHD